MKELPLNGRSFDQLLTLNTGTANVSSNRSGSGDTANPDVPNLNPAFRQ